MEKINKLGKLYELMAYGDDLDAFYSMNKIMSKPMHTVCDCEIMTLIDDAKKDLQERIFKEKERQELSFMNTGSGLFSNDNRMLLVYMEWVSYWFGE